ncbi:MAG: endolytic transglycosylase MltG [Gammaproteobacteria bacterium]|nr:endolytic transglycosylase MltG [Gammaproteobacteria bacterium]
MKTLGRLYLTIGIVCLGFFLWFGAIFYNFTQTPLLAEHSKPVNIVFAPRSSATTLAYQLQRLNLISHPKRFAMLARLKGDADYLQAGEYEILPGDTPIMLLNKMRNGGFIKHEFLIVEGWTFAQILAALFSNNYITHTLNGLTTEQIMSKIGHEGEMPEGRFAPDTYVISGQVTDADILLTAYDLMAKRLGSAWQARDLALNLHCPYEALIIASIIEKETAVASEKPIIAGVILRRLERNMFLQLDPTVIYGLANATRKLTSSDLLKDTPYNTYTRKGLPESPIAMPSLSSINAALHPAPGNVLYYVAKGDGTHEFSNTLEEQNQAIKKYILLK